MSKPTIGERLMALRSRTDMSLQEIAKRAGYAGPSSVQAFFQPDYDPSNLSVKTLRILANALVGAGSPPIQFEELAELGIPHGIEHRDAYIGLLQRQPELESANGPTPTLMGQPKDVPVYASALAADLQFDAEGNGPHAVEQTVFAMNEVVAHVRRPPGLNATNVYALYVSGSSMEPRYRAGDPVFVDPRRPPSIGDDVIVQLYAPHDGEPDISAGLIKTLVRRTASHLVLQQYRPELSFTVPMERVAHIHRVIPWREAFGM